MKQYQNIVYKLKKIRLVQVIYSYLVKFTDLIYVPFQLVFKTMSNIKIFRAIFFKCLPLDKELIVSTNFGNFLINTNDRIIAKKIFINKEPYECRKVIEVLNILKEKNLKISHLIEVGANIGSVTTTFLLLDKNLTATAIEGNTYSKYYLDTNILLNSLSQRCITKTSLIGDKSKIVYFATFKGESGNSMVFELDNEIGIKKYTQRMKLKVNSIEKRKVNKLTDLEDLPLIKRETLLWLDIEGSEYSVLSGVQDLKAKPIIVFELNPSLIYSTQKSPNLFLKKFEDLFIQNAYKTAILLDKDGVSFKVEKNFLHGISEEISYSNAHSDLLIF